MGLKLLTRRSSRKQKKPGPAYIPDISIKKKMLLDDINKTRQALEIAYIKFQYVSDPELIDCYIYEINSADHRYKYLMKQMRQLTGQSAENLRQPS